MKGLIGYLGTGLMVLGAVLLAVLHLLHLTFINSLLLLPLALIVGGIFLHVWTLKRQSRY